MIKIDEYLCFPTCRVILVEKSNAILPTKMYFRSGKFSFSKVNERGLAHQRVSVHAKS